MNKIIDFQMSDHGRIQTYNLLIRSQLLYSIELHGHYFRLQRYLFFFRLQYFSMIFLRYYSINR